MRYARMFPRSTVYAIEPIPSNIAKLQTTLATYGVRNVRILPFAAAESRGHARMFVSAGQPPDRETSESWNYGNKSSSLLEPGRHLEIHPWVSFDEEIEVETRTLEDVCREYRVPRVDFIHMDVQGAELKVLDGLGERIREVRAIWLEVEAVPLYVGQPLKDEVANYLASHGFILSRDTVDEVSGDQLWVREEVARSGVKRRLSSIGRRLTWYSDPLARRGS
ncbi:MAG: FkbM family methyltransferase [Chloroflexi bacterium]|nr:FkbM family methyltransferase [Chloroflexota bacterium]